MVRLEPLAEVEGALLVVEVLHLPHPKLGGLGLGDSREHFWEEEEEEKSAKQTCCTFARNTSRRPGNDQGREAASPLPPRRRDPVRTPRQQCHGGAGVAGALRRREGWGWRAGARGEKSLQPRRHLLVSSHALAMPRPLTTAQPPPPPPHLLGCAAVLVALVRPLPPPP